MKTLPPLMEKRYWLIPVLGMITMSVFWWIIKAPHDLWIDEAFTSTLVNNNLETVLLKSTSDMHPPLFYILLKLFTLIFGYSLITLRLFSFLAYIGILLVAYFPVAKLSNKKTALFFAVIYTFTPTMSVFVLEIRMYTWAGLFTTLCVVYGYQWIITSKKTALVIMCASGIAAAYTHYYALGAVAATYIILLVYLFLQKKFLFIKQLVVCIFISILSYIPWIYILVGQMNRFFTTTYISRLEWYRYIMFPANFYYIGTSAFGKLQTYILISLPIAISVAFLVLSGFFKILKNKMSLSLSTLCISTFLLTFLFFVSFSIIVKPLYNPRYLMCMFGLLCIYLADSLSSVKSKALISAILCSFMISGFINLYIEDKKHEDLPMTNMFQYIEKESTPETFFVSEGMTIRFINFYLPKANLLNALPTEPTQANEGWVISSLGRDREGSAKNLALQALEGHENTYKIIEEVVIYSYQNNSDFYAIKLEKIT